jgi:heat shock protein HslJ
MRLPFLTLALLAAATPAAAQPPEPEGEIYAAHGTEPFWGLTFEDGKMIYTFDEERVEVPRPRPTATRNGVLVYRTPRMTVEISHEGRCNDGMGEYEYPDTVRVRFGRSRGAAEGCGGGILPPATLANTDWYIVDINGTIVGGENYELHFDGEGRLSGRAGCNRFSGPYTQRSHALTPGAIVATRMACPGERMTHEARMLELLRGPIQFYTRGGMIMTLQQRDGSPGITAILRRQ